MARKPRLKVNDQVITLDGYVMNVIKAPYDYRGRKVVDIKDGETERKRVSVSSLELNPVFNEPKQLVDTALNSCSSSLVPSNKYERVIRNKEGCEIIVDVYDVLQAFNVTDPAIAHAIKKALAPGQRGHKTFEQDLNDISVSIDRAKDLYRNRQQ